MAAPPPVVRTTYTVGSHRIHQVSHTLPPLLGHCPADSYILHPPPTSPLPTLVLSFRHHPSLSSSPLLHTQAFALLTSLLSLSSPSTHGHLSSFEADTHIGDAVNKGVVVVQLPPASLQAWRASLGVEGGGGVGGRVGEGGCGVCVAGDGG